MWRTSSPRNRFWRESTERTAMALQAERKNDTHSDVSGTGFNKNPAATIARLADRAQRGNWTLSTRAHYKQKMRSDCGPPFLTRPLHRIHWVAEIRKLQSRKLAGLSVGLSLTGKIPLKNLERDDYFYETTRKAPPGPPTRDSRNQNALASFFEVAREPPRSTV